MLPARPNQSHGAAPSGAGRGRISEDDLQAVRDRLPVLDVIAEHTAVRTSGPDSYMAVCPLHEESTASLHVTPSRGVWHCFGCGEGGDVLAFLMKLTGASFREAVEQAAARAGVTLSTTGAEDPGAAARRRLADRMREAHVEAARFYTALLGTAEAEAARTELTGRHFTAAHAAAHELGYAPEEWDRLTRHLTARGFTREELLGSGLSVQGGRGLYDQFRNRLLWPVRDLSGTLVGFGGRRLSNDPKAPKYLNSPDTPIFHKSELLFNASRARRAIARARAVIVVEGYTDGMAFDAAGLEHVVASCGTSFTEGHLALVRRLLTDENQSEIVFAFDPDEAGAKAARRVFSLVSAARVTARTSALVAPEGLDPCDVRRVRGDQALRDLYEARRPLAEVVLREAVRGYDLTTPDGCQAAANSAAPLLDQLHPHLREDYAKIVAGWLGIPPQRLAPGRRPSSASSAAPAQERPGPGRAPQIEVEAARALVRHHAAALAYLPDLPPDEFTSPVLRALTALARQMLPECANAGEWVHRLLGAAEDEQVRRAVTALAASGPGHGHSEDGAGIAAVFASLHTSALERRIAAVKAELRRSSADPERSRPLLEQLQAMDAERRRLRQVALGRR